jgi:hypothetical protein
MPCSSEPARTARLSIRAAADAARSAVPVPALLRRLRDRWGLVMHPAACATAIVDIRDLQGHQVLEVREARPPLDLELPAGTYHVRIDAGDRRRLYTVVLEPGTCCELRVHAPPGELAA